MKGVIKTFIPEKNYGFIKGEDTKDYFFHLDAFGVKQDKNYIYDEVMVEFEPRATPKGYSAKNCILINPSDVVTYVIPDDFPTSRSSSIKGWDIIEMGDWIVHGTSKDSPDAAKKDLIDSAMRVGANALVEVEYYKTRDSKSSIGTGTGTYYFTVHNFRGRIVTVAKKSFSGKYQVDELLRVNRLAESVKKELDVKTEQEQQWLKFFWGTISIVVLILTDKSHLSFLAGLMIIIVCIIELHAHSINHGHWLEKKQ